ARPLIRMHSPVLENSVLCDGILRSSPSTHDQSRSRTDLMQLKRKIDTGLRWLGSRRDARGGILLYHRIDAADVDPFNLCVSPSHFEEQLAMIAETGLALPVHQFMEQKKRGQLKRGSISLTFDDGYLDVFTNALPLLKKYEIPATVFVTSGNLGEAFWWDRLASLIHGPNSLPDSLFIEPGQSSPFLLESASRSNVYNLLYPILRSASPKRREVIFKTLASQIEVPSDNRPQRCATSSEVREASSHPLITIGAHTVTHSRLSTLSYEKQLEEISESIETLSDLTGQSIDLMSYPFGLRDRDFDSTTMRAAKEAGIRYAFAADLNEVTAQTNEFAIPRLWVHDRGVQNVRRTLQLWTGIQFQRQVELSA
ncbi:MAG: polysaccharide deacetylase family protein, partial [Verrucomicrobiota bacterium]